MSEIAPSGVNAEQIEFWNGTAATGWVDNQDQMDALLEPLSQSALARAALKSGDAVLDVGCGCGATSLQMARVGARVTGIDISAPMLASARERAAAAKLDISFVLADASTHAFEPIYDLLFSRFGVMFFANPVAAFTNLRTALVTGGRMAFICWQAPRENAWMSAPAAAVADLLPPTPAADPHAPGPFAFADRAYLTGVLAQAGFAEVKIDGVEAQLLLGRSVDEAMTFALRVGPLSRPLAALGDDAKQQAVTALRRQFTQHERNGAVRLGARCWVVTGRRVD
jgi:ubiquinone/menaquinone biosynthesis C-methylase UbiE